jgi:hypothetical protein
VSEVVPGESMALRDLVRGGDPVWVTERSGSRNLHQWDRIATRVIPVRPGAVISVRPGAVISGKAAVLDHESSEELFASLDRVCQIASKSDPHSRPIATRWRSTIEVERLAFS